MKALALILGLLLLAPPALAAPPRPRAPAARSPAPARPGAPAPAPAPAPTTTTTPAGPTGAPAAGPSTAPPAPENENDGGAGQASRHFQRGVELYNEGDYRGALGEFQKAYLVLPRAPVLYNIGQTEYQVHEYASSLRTLERFLAETGPNAAHRQEVEETVAVLRTRVGRVVLTADRRDCEVTVDEQASGTTPLNQSLLVTAGRRRLAVICPDHQQVGKEVDVAAGDTVFVELRLAAAAAAGVAAGAQPMTLNPGAESTGGARGRLIAWITTGVLGAAAAGAYTAAALGSRQLQTLRRTYPVTPRRLDDRATMNSRLALAGDILAAATVVAAGVSTYLSLGARAERNVGLGLTVGGLTVHGNF